MAAVSNPEIFRLDRIVRPQLPWRRRIDNPTFFEDVDVIDRVDCQGGILFDEQDRQALPPQLAYHLPHALDDDRRNPSDGSSMIRQSGLVIRPRPIASICCSPPDSVRALW